jgi:hypothetical protein
MKNIKYYYLALCFFITTQSLHAVDKTIIPPITIKVTKMKSLPSGYQFKNKEDSKKEWIMVELTANKDILTDELQLSCLWFANRMRPQDKNKNRAFQDKNVTEEVLKGLLVFAKACNRN